MGEENILDLIWMNRERFPVSVGVIPFLKHSTIDDGLHSTSFQEKA
jgi:hypothetical protein